MEKVILRWNRFLWLQEASIRGKLRVYPPVRTRFQTMHTAWDDRFKAVFPAKYPEESQRLPPEVKAAELTLETILTHYKVRHLANLGGFKGIAERLLQETWPLEDASVLVSQIRQKATTYSWSRERSRDRSGRSH